MKDLVKHIVAYAELRNVDTTQLCKLSHIDKKALAKKDGPAPTAAQIGSLWANAIHLTRDKLFGLHFGESLRTTALGIVGSIIQSSATVGEALTHAAALVHVITGQCRMEIVQGKGTFKVILTQTTREGINPLMEVFMVIVIHELDGLLLTKITPKAVALPYKVTDPVEYARVFRCAPVKSNGEYSITLSAQYWEEPILTANYQLQEILLQQTSHLPKPDNKTQLLGARIHNYLLANSYLGLASLNDIASNFNMSARTLQRQLKNEGSSYQHIADTVKRSLAEHYIASGNFALKDISWMLGYNELSAFSRAFKKWTGVSPESFG
ncbi:AraC-type DNA-binding protein [Chitinophaga jiangningensis]|uniref:AraC-type DNA-binding protein n=1 Tax=Chitinophaga jiangningensis TaxID=1419482 RepID=A0A1M7M2W3_9BACT|nr:AraC family transcriptional regulator [Chitinophaga jiangningensis]SHM84545.1 AraC-type DNA-binding protein [Chitinophaga jiangningensis]